MSTLDFNDDLEPLELADEPEPEPEVIPGQVSMFTDENAYENWAEEWVGMPEFEQRNLNPVKTISVHFSSLDDLTSFAQLVGQKITPLTKSIWHPEAEVLDFKTRRYGDDHAV